MSENKYKIINNWLLDNYAPFYGNWIYFNATPYITGTISASTIPGLRNVSEDILGNKKKELTLAIDFVTEYDPQGTSDINLDMIQEADTFSEWVESINKNKQFPTLGDNIEINKLEVLDNTPNLLVDSTQALAKYQIQIRFDYNEYL